MDDLYIEAHNSKIPVEKNVANKYNLEKGIRTPFTRYKIVGPNGEFPSETSMVNDSKNETSIERNPSEDTENVMMSTSEIIDFSQGVDSDTGQ